MLFEERLSAAEIKPLFEAHVEHLMKEETRALSKVFEFCEWDDASDFDFHP